MMLEDNINYHTARARKELDMGLLSQSISASRAHLQLASLHMQKLRELTGSSVKPPLAM